MSRLPLPRPRPRLRLRLLRMGVGCALLMLPLAGCDIVTQIRADGSAHLRVSRPTADCPNPTVSSPDNVQTVRGGSSNNGQVCVSEWSVAAGGGTWKVDGWQVILRPAAGGWEADVRDEDRVSPPPRTVLLETSGRPLSYNSARPGADRTLRWRNPQRIHARWTTHTGPTVWTAAVFGVGAVAAGVAGWKLRRR